tara:strand:- start:762 stop:1661 length:900 start_codon:yes stop_codon:yes gene_type:complete
MSIIRIFFFSLLLYSFAIGIDDPLFADHTTLLSLFSTMESDIYNDSDAIVFIEKNNLKNDFFKVLEIFNARLSTSLNNPNFILEAEENNLQLFKNDSKYFTQIKKGLNAINKSKIVNTFESKEYSKVWSESTDTTPFDYFSNNFILSYKLSSSINHSSGANTASYENGYDFDITIYHPEKLEIFNKHMLLSFNLSTSFITVKRDNNIRSNSIDIDLSHYLNKIPIFFSSSVGIIKHSDNGICASFGLLGFYKIDFDNFDLLIGIEYNKFIDISKNYKFSLLDQDLLGIKISLKKDIIIN